MRIGIDASSLPTTVAGAGKYICNLIRALAQIDRDNEYLIFAKAGTQNLFGALPAENFCFVPLPNFSRPARLLWQHCGAGLQSRQNRIEVWHGLHYSLPYFVGPARTVSTFHDVAFFLHPQLYPPIKRLYFQQAIRRALATADAIVTVSQSTADDVRRLFKGSSGFPERKLHVVHSGVEAKFFSHVCAAQIKRAKTRHGLNSPYLLFVGTFEKRKNLPLLIEAFSRLRRRGQQNLLLVLAGQSDNGRAEIERTIAKENLQSAVRCLGYVADADILPLYHGAKLLVLPSVHEGFGFPLLEAMAGGVPVLAADNSAMRELAVDPEMLCAGDAETWAQKIERLLVDHELRQELIVRGRQHARTFSWQQTARATLAVYESLLPPRHAMPVRIVRAFDLKALASSAAARHGSVPVMKISSSNGYRNGFEKISVAVLKTLAYADLFDYPLRAEEVHEGLLDCGASFAEVLETLESWESRGVIARTGPLFFLRGRGRIVAVREQRRQQTRALLQKHAWLLKFVAKFPCVRSVSLSGAAAFENSHHRDDVDLFVITAGKRLWSVYTALALLLKLMGKRRLLCLNCLIDLEHLRIDEGDFFIAHQIAFLRPLSGIEHFKKFHAANAWVSAHLPQSRPESRSADSLSAKTASLASHGLSEGFWLKNFLETIWSWRLFDYLERLIFGFYRRRIRRLTEHAGAESVVVEPGQIKLFTNNHRHRIKNALHQRLQQILKTELLEVENETSQAVF